VASPSDGQDADPSARAGAAAEALTRPRLDLLLARLAPDREAAAAEYERVRRRLMKLFEWWGSASPADDADHTIDRVARKLEEGETVLNPLGYIHGVARNVLLEGARRRFREDAAGRELVAQVEPAGGEAADARIDCLERCLRNLPAESRDLIVGYYQGPGKSHLASRKGLARELGISYPVLKAKAHRLRGRLQECLRRCLAGETNDAPESHPVRGKR